MFYRISQFLSALRPHISSAEKDFIQSILTSQELAVFNKLTISDQQHSVRIARYLAMKEPENILLQRAALMHDIGKIVRPLNPFEKSFTVILHELFPQLAKRLATEKNSIMDIYYNHAEKGAEIAEKLHMDSYIVYLIKHHHNPDIDDANLKFLIKADDIY